MGVKLSRLTGLGWVLAEVSGLVALEEAGGLDFGGRATGKSGVEVTDTLHASGILSGTDGLGILSAQSCPTRNQIQLFAAISAQRLWSPGLVCASMEGVGIRTVGEATYELVSKSALVELIL